MTIDDGDYVTTAIMLVALPLTAENVAHVAEHDFVA
jgi:hypothetical protein